MSELLKKDLEMLLFKEKNMKKVRFDYVVSIQNEISEQDRYDLVCSIIDLCESENLHKYGTKLIETAVKYIDILLSEIRFKQNDINFLLYAALFTSLQMEDQNGAINFMDDLTQSGVDTTSVFQIQMRLFKCMQWNLIIITFSDILNTFLLYFEQDVENLDEIKDAIVYYYISALTYYEFVQFKSSSIMIVCLNKILVDFKQEELFEKIFNHIFSLKILDENDIKACFQTFSLFVSKTNTHILNYNERVKNRDIESDIERANCLLKNNKKGNEIIGK